MRVFAPLILVALMAGCGSSPPKRFYVLDPVPGQSRATPKSSVAVQVAAVNIPPALDRQEMVREIAPNTLDISDRHRWGGPLADMMQDVLTQDLIRRLPEGAVVLPQTNAPTGSEAITVDILQFACNESGVVVFDGGWSLFRVGSDTPLFSRHVNLSEKAAPSDYADQVRAMSAILGRLADTIADSLARGDGAPVS